MTLELVFLGIGALLILSVVAARFGSYFKLPSMLIFIGIGMLLGSEGPGGIPFDDAELTSELGLLAMAVIIFGAGLSTPFKLVRQAGAPATSLSTIGVVLSMGLMAVAAHYLVGMEWIHALLLGAILAPTDAAAVFAALKESPLKLPEKLVSIVEVESATNDPLSIFLVMTITALAVGQLQPSWALVFLPIWNILFGAIIGIALGYLSVLLLRFIRFDLIGFSFLFSIGVALVAFEGADLLGGNGFLAVYLCGLVMGNSELRHKHQLRQLHDANSWLMQVGLFLLLGLLVFPTHLLQIWPMALMLGLVLALLARPLSVMGSLMPFKFPLRDQAALSWAGLRGAAPIVLATIPLAAGVSQAGLIFNVVFFAVLVSALLQGTTLSTLTGKLFGTAQKE
ncbi:MAG: potassium/proton antiporter [Fimbriimonadaceae bacterium]